MPRFIQMVVKSLNSLIYIIDFIVIIIDFVKIFEVRVYIDWKM